MKFVDKHIFKEDRFSIGKEVESNTPYISIPVANPYVEYEEYYKISQHQYDICPGNVDELREIANKCRQRSFDENLIIKPGTLRGSPI